MISLAAKLLVLCCRRQIATLDPSETCRNKVNARHELHEHLRESMWARSAPLRTLKLLHLPTDSSQKAYEMSLFALKGRNETDRNRLNNTQNNRCSAAFTCKVDQVVCLSTLMLQFEPTVSKRRPSQRLRKGASRSLSTRVSSWRYSKSTKCKTALFSLHILT